MYLIDGRKLRNLSLQTLLFRGFSRFLFLFTNLYLIGVKSYLRYKTITSQNASIEGPGQEFFLFRRKVLFCSQDIQVFLLLIIP